MTNETDTASESRSGDGFELDGEFYPFRTSTHARDLLLIERFSRLGPAEFFELVEDAFERQRTSVLLAVMATSLRSAREDWSLERIERRLLSIEDLWGEEEVKFFLEGDALAVEESPPTPAPEEEPSTPTTSDSSSDESSSSPTPPEPSEPETSPDTPSTSGPPGSATGSESGGPPR